MSEEKSNINVDDLLSSKLANSVPENDNLINKLKVTPESERGIPPSNEKPEIPIGGDDRVRGNPGPVSREVAEAPAPIDDPEETDIVPDSDKETKVEREYDPSVIRTATPEDDGKHYLAGSIGQPVGQAGTEKATSQHQTDFGVINKGQLAVIAYEAMNAYANIIGDNVRCPWESAQAWEKKVIMEGVDAHLKDNLSPMDSHASWMRKKFDEGWKYGPVKDVETKTHPQLVPYAELPPAQQAKDFLFRSIIQGLKLFLKDG